MAVDPFVCLNATPGYGCNLPESLVLGVLHLFSGLLCFLFLIRHCQKSKLENHASKAVMLHVTVFWFFMMTWLLYRGVLWIVPFNYSHMTFLLFHSGLNQILYLIPISILILVLCELLYSYYNPGKSYAFFRIIFVVFLWVFLTTGISLSLIKEEDYVSDESSTNKNDNSIMQRNFIDSPLHLWSGATNLIVLVYVAIPSIKLIRAVSYPVTQPEDVGCIRWSIVGVAVFSFLSLLRCIYNVLQHFQINPVANWFNRELFAENGPTINARIFNIAFYTVFDLVTVWMANVGVFTLYKHDMRFADDPFYARTVNDVR